MQNFAPDGAEMIEKGTKWAKGHLYTLMGHISCHIWALIATAEPQKLEKCPQKNSARYARNVKISNCVCVCVCV